MTELINMMGCRYPIIQGPVGEMNSPRLVAAICYAGAYYCFRGIRADWCDKIALKDKIIELAGQRSRPCSGKTSPYPFFVICIF